MRIRKSIQGGIWERIQRIAENRGNHSMNPLMMNDEIRCGLFLCLHEMSE